jgi:hypothetical protein
LTIVSKITDAIFNEIRSVVRKNVEEAEVEVKRRIKKLVVIGIVTSIMGALVISMLGTASLFLMIGELKYLSLTMPAWEAFDVMGITSGLIGAVLLVVLLLIVRKQLSS